MFTHPHEVIRYIQSEKINFIHLLQVDLAGRLRCLSMPAAYCDEAFLTEGFGFDASNYGFRGVENSDMVVIPDITSAFRDPFRHEPSLAMFGLIHSIEGGEQRFADDLRFVAENAEKLISDATGGGTLMLGPEYEFYVFAGLEHQVGSAASGYRVTPLGNDNLDNPDDGKLGVSHYHMSPPFDRLGDFRDSAVMLMEEMGIAVKYHHHEVGEFGQLEIETGFGTIREMADTTMKIKYVIHNLARQQGLRATFMPKPLAGHAGNGHHVHMKLTGGTCDYPFSNEQGYAGLSDTALGFIAGILSHAPALSGLCNPSTNSYKRLVAGFEAPTAIVFATSNRSSAIRIPGYVQTAQDRRFEYRPPDFTANPYLAYSALAVAGVAGYQQKLDPIALGYGPIDCNLENLSVSRQKKVRWLPNSLEQSLEALRKDQGFLIDSGVFRSSLLDSWRILKEKELEKIRRQPHPMEFQLYGSL